MHIAVRADGGPGLGYGHLVRSSALSEELLARGHQVTYMTTTPGPTDSTSPDGCNIVELHSRTNPQAFVDAADVDFDVVVIDSYAVGTEYQRVLHEQSSVVVVSDEPRQIAADVVVNGNLYAPELSYDVIGKEPEWCLGPEYLLLRADVARLAEKSPPSRNPPERAVVVLGGSDEAELTPTVVRAFDGTDVRVDAIVGPGCSDDQASAVTRAAAETDASVSVVRSPSDLPRRLFEADFAVTTASTTVYELLALGTYPIAFPIVDNQERIAAALKRRDLGTVLSRRPTVNQITIAVDEISKKVRIKKQQRRGRRLVDGRGASRVCDACSIGNTIDR